MHSMKTGWKMRKIYALLLVVILALSAFLSACGGKGDETPSPSPTSTPSPTATASPKPALIKDGNFEEAYDTSYPKLPKRWSIYGDSFDNKTAPLSYKDKENDEKLTVKRGIISVKDDLFEENKSKYGDIENPGKPEDASPDDDNIIMIYNEFPTAAKYKSQSISLPAGAYGKITVYVKTLDIKPSDPDHPENYENYEFYGATVALSGMEEPIIIAGIDTNKQWVKYEFYLEGSPSASKTLYVELGLGTGSPSDSRGYTQGHAFFDAVSMDYINKAEYETVLKELDRERFFFYDGDKESPNSFLVNRIDAKVNPEDWTYFAYSYINRDTIDTYTFEELELAQIDIDESLYYDTVDPTEFVTESGFVEVGGEDLKGFDEELKNFPFSSEKVFYLKNKTSATQGFKTKDFVLKPHSPAFGNTGIQQSYSYYRITVYLKTADFVSNGLNLLLVAEDASGEEYNNNLFENINTAKNNLSDEDLEQEANRHNKWANWVEYSFYVQANPYEDVTWHLELWLGPYDVRAKQINKFTRGHALFAEMQVQRLTYSEYSSASSKDNVKTGIRFFETKSPQIANAGFNSTTDNTGAIVNRPVNPSSWDGRFGGYSSLKDGGSLVEKHYNGAVISGIINQNYLEAYKDNNYIDDTLKYGDVDNISNSGAPNYLMIRNVESTSYGYLSQSKVLSANSIYRFVISVKTFGSAKAYVYIVDEEYKVLDASGTKASFENVATNGWETFEFFIKTGELSKTIRIELWNGARDGSATSMGYVLFDDITMSSGWKQEVYDEAEAGDRLTKLSFEGIDVAPTPTPSPTSTPEPTEEPEPGEFKFPWDMLITGLMALALIASIVVISIRKAKKSKLFRPRKVKAKEPSYSRNRLKIRERVVDEEAEEEADEEAEEEAEPEKEPEEEAEEEGENEEQEGSDEQGDNE